VKKYFLLIFFATTLFFPVYAQEAKNPSLAVEIIKIPWNEFNLIAREASIIEFENIHDKSWQATIDNNLLYANPDGNAVLRIYDSQVEDKFIEIGMGSPPDKKYWIAAKMPKEGYVVVHSKLERGWIPQAKTIVSYTPIAGMTVNNGERIVVSNLDIEQFAIRGYSVHGMEGSTDPPAVSSGEMIVEFLSGDSSQNIFHLFPFFLAAGIGILVGALILTKKRS